MQPNDYPIELAILDELTGEAFDQLPFGAILIDEEGVVLRYNAFEAALARRNADDVIGQNFFTDVAPCTNIDQFRGVLERMRSTGALAESFDFRFLFDWGARRVRIGLLLRLPAGSRGTWIVVTPLDEPDGEG